MLVEAWSMGPNTHMMRGQILMFEGASSELVECLLEMSTKTPKKARNRHKTSDLVIFSFKIMKPKREVKSATVF